MKEEYYIETSDLLGKRIKKLYDEYNAMQKNYSAAIREVKTKLEILDEDFQALHEHNPIHYMKSRIKSPESIVRKLESRELPISFKAVAENIFDVAGIRVICHYIEDIYTVSELLSSQTDIQVVIEKDYIKNPKENGYRSLHLIVEVPVFFVGGVVNMPVEIQIRTIAMDFWASLEHQLRYKSHGEIPEFIADELKECARDINKNDVKMQKIHSFLNDLEKTKSE
ncbi:MAG: GTP pyrophosphokinase family protein [Eubacteriales bacterium]|nr:GTP pyrophosphokinase family protein [Eubacteriales bacterium]MDD4389267.1 GTP pyrophosphokinase family protein [Eubacteriales bacterium]